MPAAYLMKGCLRRESPLSPREEEALERGWRPGQRFSPDFMNGIARAPLR
jgi:hypothetical protein